MCQPGSTAVTKGQQTPKARAPDSSQTTNGSGRAASTPPTLDKASLPARSSLNQPIPTPKIQAPKREEVPLTKPIASTQPRQASPRPLPSTPSPQASKAAPENKEAVPTPQTPKNLPTNAPIEQQIKHFFEHVIPPILKDALTRHHASYDDKIKKGIVTDLAFELTKKFSEFDSLKTALRLATYKDPTTLTIGDFKEGQFRAKVNNKIKELLDQHKVPKDIRPLFLR